MRLNVTDFVVNGPALAHPDRLAIVDGNGHVSYAALSELALHVANTLLEFKCPPGSRILVCMADSAHFVAVLLGILKVGAVAVPVNGNATVADYAFYLDDTSATFAYADQQGANLLLPATHDSSITVLMLDEKYPFESIHVCGAGRELSKLIPAKANSCCTRAADPALILYTSGSTGRQKAVVHCHGAVIAALQSVGVDAFGIQAGDMVLSSARLSFAFGLGFGMYMPLLVGASTILRPTKDVKVLANIIAALRPSILCGVPSLLNVLLRASETWLDLDLSSLRFVVSAGEPLAGSTFDAYKARFGLEVLDGIGSTELLTHFITNRPGRARRGSCGTPVSGCTVSLVDAHGNAVPDGDIGSLRVKADTAFLGYWRKSKGYAHLESSEETATGDMLYRDGDGFYHYCGRDDDMLKVSGLWVSPCDIESVLSGHPGVERCVVTVREDDSGRRRLVAYVIANSLAQLHIQDLYRFAGERLPDFMVPSAFVAVGELPSTANGKLRRAALPQPAWNSPN
jgi:acyl-coenzyme A synthetase/AMP-(fatty) acid ligase